MAKTQRRPRGREAPAASDSTPKTALEEFLVACQKSLARSVRNSQQSAKADNEFALGERPQYMIDGLDFEVNAALSMPAGDTGPTQERVLLDFGAPADVRSRIRFRVQTKPVELLKGAKLELANLDPLGASAPVARMRAWLVDEGGHPVPDAEIRLHFARAGEKVSKRFIRATTDCAGRVDFFVHPETDEVKLVGDRRRKKVFLRGSGRGINADEFFVWATARRRPEWGAAASPSAPYPPQPAERSDEGELTALTSELHRLRLE
ncbi:MAG: hypothetical protein AB7N65_17100 [Vicinamibacterales bacterium]